MLCFLGDYVTHRNKSFRVLRVGKKGEIYTTSDIRAGVGIKKGGFLIAYVDGNKIVIRPLEPELRPFPPSLGGLNDAFILVEPDLH
jgi:bifunctional DNA-binding transcriptional regulator/antitoxin component of YhaV-PrlF toxin-antitoxin module